MQKQITAAAKAKRGDPVRLWQGPWPVLCHCVAAELDTLGAGRTAVQGADPPPTAAILIFSTSERSSRDRDSAALTLRKAIQSKVRVYNPRNKTAATSASPVAQLLGLISYLIDPVSRAPAGANGRLVEVAASMGDPAKVRFARSKPPDFPVSQAHLAFQKKFRKGDQRDLDATPSERRPVLQFVDSIRDQLAGAAGKSRKPRLTLAGFVSRLLSLPYFSHCGFSVELFRQALFTELLEANIAATRLTKDSLEQPLSVEEVGGKLVWPDRFWSFLNLIGAYLQDAALDDLEVETFEDGAVLMITFHQGKGLEFDHVYVAGTGREPDVGPALRTLLFSGETPKYTTTGGLATSDKKVLALAEADREREVYVALSRAKKRLTILNDPQDDFAHMPLNKAIERLFRPLKASPHPSSPEVKVKEWLP